MNWLKMILHSSFDGSDRQTNQIYQDDMTCVRNYDRPDIFYDTYAHPKCSETAAEMEPEQTAPLTAGIDGKSV